MQKINVYLDYNATARMTPSVLKVVCDVLAEPYNASSVHAFGRKAKSIIENAREKVSNAAGADGADVIFTSSGTEANNLAIKGIKDVSTIIVSAVEHISVLKPASEMGTTIIPVDQNGVVDLNALEKILDYTKGKPLVSVMLANNETGVIQPIKQIASLVYPRGGLLHCDAAQAFGKIPVDFNKLNVDMMTVSAHKFGGSQGAAALICKRGINISPLHIGGNQESGYRAGTENIAAIAGFGTACENIKNMNSELRNYMEQKLESYAQDIEIFGKNVERLPNTSCISMLGMQNETQVIAFDLSGIAVSAGAACSSRKIEPSHVLTAMNVSKDKISSSIRVSLGNTTTKEEIDKFINVWKENYDKIRSEEAA